MTLRLSVVFLFCLLPRVEAKVDFLILAAGEAELAPVRARMVGVQEITLTSWTFWTGTLGGRPVVLARTEGDPLNAVASTTLAIRRFAPGLALTYGVARAHDPSLRLGDAIVSERFVPFDGFVSGRRERGEGVRLADWKKLPHAPISAGEVETYTESFPADQVATQAALALPNTHGRVLAGVLGSAHQINREADRLAWLRTTWGTSCEDFESAHVAVCAQMFGVPAAGIRVVLPADAGPAETASAQTQASALLLAWVEALK